jgi:hypothetical protein
LVFLSWTKESHLATIAYKGEEEQPPKIHHFTTTM